MKQRSEPAGTKFNQTTIIDSFSKIMIRHVEQIHEPKH
jgi:hypothetical protein